MTKRLFSAVSLLATFLFFGSSWADTIFIGGYNATGNGSNDIHYPLLAQVSTSNNSLTTLSVLPGQEGEIESLAFDASGIAFLSGYYSSSELPLSGKVPAGSSSATIFSTSQGLLGELFDVAVTPNNVALFVGLNVTDNTHISPLAYSLNAGSSSLVQLSIPMGSDEGYLRIAVARPDGTVILAGVNQTTNVPTVFVWDQGIVTALTLPNSDLGSILCGAVTSDGTVILGGGNSTTSESLIYRIVGNTIENIPPQSGDEALIEAIAINSAGTAILVGETTSSAPIAYSLGSSSSSLSSITVPTDHEGSLYCIAIGSDDVAVIGGFDETTNVVFLYRLASNASEMTPVGDNNIEGFLFCAGVDSNNTAILGGQTIDNAPFVYTLAANSSTPTFISGIFNPSYPFGKFQTIGIYTNSGLYNFYRLQAIYQQQLEQAKAKLRASNL